MKYTPPRKPVAPFKCTSPSTGVAKAETTPQRRLDCPLWTERQCILAREVMNELYLGAQVETKADYAAFLARVTEQHSYTGQEWHGAGTASQMYHHQTNNVRLRLMIKNLLTLEIEDIYQIIGRGATFAALGR